MEDYAQYQLKNLLTYDSGSPGETTRVLCSEYIRLKELCYTATEAFDHIFELRVSQLSVIISDLIEQEDISKIKIITQNDIPAFVLFDFLITRNFRAIENKDLIKQNLSLILDVIIQEFQSFSINNEPKEILKASLRKSYLKLINNKKKEETKTEIIKPEELEEVNESMFNFYQPPVIGKFGESNIQEFKINITTKYFEINTFKINLSDIASIEIKDNFNAPNSLSNTTYYFKFLDFENGEHGYTHHIGISGLSLYVIDPFRPYYQELIEFVNDTIFDLLFLNYLNRLLHSHLYVGPFRITNGSVLLYQNFIISKKEKFIDWKNIECKKHLGEYGYKLSDRTSINTSLSSFNITEWQFRVLKKLASIFQK